MKKTFLVKKILSYIGITPKRSLPDAAKNRFSSWYNNYKQPTNEKKVALFLDTFTEFNEPSIGIAAVKVLNSFGFFVDLIPYSCCGRPMISKGMLKQAKKQAEILYESVKPHIENQVTVLTLEPSCLSALTDDYQGLIGKSIPSLSIAEFLTEIDLKQIPLKDTPLKVKIHGHCHQKALTGIAPSLLVLSKLPGISVEEIPSGCCGVAGSFGYEEEHYELSQKIGDLVLIPAVAENNVTILADGTSCRHQIHHGAGRHALHIVEFVATRLA